MKIFPKSVKQVREEHFRKSRGDRSLENKVFLHCCISFFKDLWKSCTDLVGMNDQHLCVLLMLAIFHESYFRIDEQSWLMRCEELSFLLPDTFCLASFDGWVYFFRGLPCSPVPFPKIHLLILKFPCFGISLHAIETVGIFFCYLSKWYLFSNSPCCQWGKGRSTVNGAYFLRDALNFCFSYGCFAISDKTDECCSILSLRNTSIK